MFQVEAAPERWFVEKLLIGVEVVAGCLLGGMLKIQEHWMLHVWQFTYILPLTM